jgi:hypothetical protein
VDAQTFVFHVPRPSVFLKVGASMTREMHAICPSCGSTQPIEHAFCSACGAPLATTGPVAGSVVGQPAVPAAGSAHTANWPLLATLGAVGILITSIFSVATFALVLSEYRAAPPVAVAASTPASDPLPTAVQAAPVATATSRPKPTSTAIVVSTVQPSAIVVAVSTARPTATATAPSAEWAITTPVTLTTVLITATAPISPSFALLAATEGPPECTSWRDGGQYVGTYQCLCGTVTDTYQDPNSAAFFINFTSDRSAFYAISFEHRWTNLEDHCIQVCGQIETYQGRPQIVIRDLGQLVLECP